MVASDTIAVGVAEADLRDRIFVVTPFEREWADRASIGVVASDDRDWFGYSLDHVSMI